MTDHGRSVARYGTHRVAFDVAFCRRRYAAAGAREDARDWVEFPVPELPWTLRFYFVRWEDDDGSRGQDCVGFSIGEPLPADADPNALDRAEVTPSRMAVLWENFLQYQHLAHDLLYSPANLAPAVHTRTGMLRRRRTTLDDAYLAGLVAEIRAHEKDGVLPPGALTEIQVRRGLSRSQLYRQRRRAEERGIGAKRPPR